MAVVSSGGRSRSAEQSAARASGDLGRVGLRATFRADSTTPCSNGGVRSIETSWRLTMPMADQEFENCCRDLWSLSYKAAYRVTGSREQSEDVAQSTVLKAYNSWSEIRTFAEPWVVRVATNLAINLERRATVLRRITPRLSTPSHSASSAELLPDRLALRDALARLSERQRSVVVLTHLYGYTMIEAAEVLGMSVGTAKTHAARGLRALRRELIDKPNLAEIVGSGAAGAAEMDPGVASGVEGQLRNANAARGAVVRMAGLESGGQGMEGQIGEI